MASAIACASVGVARLRTGIEASATLAAARCIARLPMLDSNGVTPPVFGPRVHDRHNGL